MEVMGHGGYTTAARVQQLARFEKLVTIKKLSRILTTAFQNLLYKLIHQYLVSFARRCHFQIIFFLASFSFAMYFFVYPMSTTFAVFDILPCVS